MQSRCDLWGVISALLVSCYASRDPTHYLSSKRYPLWSVVSWAEQRIFDRLVENPSHYLRIPSDAQQGQLSAVSKRNILTTPELSIWVHHCRLWQLRRLCLLSVMILTNLRIAKSTNQHLRPAVCCTSAWVPILVYFSSYKTKQHPGQLRSKLLVFLNFLILSSNMIDNLIFLVDDCQQKRKEKYHSYSLRQQ